MTRKFEVGDKVKLNPNMDYSCINLFFYNKYKKEDFFLDHYKIIDYLYVRRNWK